VRSDPVKSVPRRPRFAAPDGLRPDPPAAAVPLLAESVGFALRQAQLVVHHDFQAALADLDLRPGQFVVLLAIHQLPDSSQTRIASLLRIEKANFVAQITDLVGQGLVQRGRSASDRRSYRLALTRTGRERLQSALRRQQQYEARLTVALGAEGRRQLLEILSRLHGTS
jgi:DNA-binding MarR family transcriptional regulator